MLGTRLRSPVSVRFHELSPECPRILSRLLKRAPRRGFVAHPSLILNTISAEVPDLSGVAISESA